ncbi:NAD(P)/FAD-dependent oxidoreductase [Prochlorococcus marinus]|uniref:NAD(P)/FAD-dependent oxidoreductase n=1 Tax=Prochlorococcus marinus TaxID=1219 RepID=UPI0022B44880|nr:FAD-dependent oxidoreductase [Prochlorococcus marinus]
MIKNHNPNCKDIGIIGGGVIGATTAFYLAKAGHNIHIFDPELNQPILTTNSLTGTKASLGIIMGNIFRRSSGRSWKLRQRSMALWPNLIREISTSKYSFNIETPLIQLATSYKEAELMKGLADKRFDLGLKVLDKNDKGPQERIWPTNLYGGLISEKDGRINPLKLLYNLFIYLKKLKVVSVNKNVSFLTRQLTNNQVIWNIHLDNDKKFQKDIVIICAALGSEHLLKKFGYKIPLEPILGQGLELNIKEVSGDWNEWPSVLISNGVALIPQTKNKLLMGATIEPGIKPSEIHLEEMLKMNGIAPHWIKTAQISNHWFGVRAKPKNRPAPVLEVLEKGLIINAAHYRNGILLAPACAEWVLSQIENVP